MSERLFDEEFVLAVRAGHRLAGREKVRLAELAGEPLCLLGKKFCTRRIIDDGFARAGLPPTVAVEMNSVEGAVAEAGGPATILPALALTRQTLNTLRLERPALKRRVSLLTLKGPAPMRARIVFVELVKRHLSPAITVIPLVGRGWLGSSPRAPSHYP